MSPSSRATHEASSVRGLRGFGKGGDVARFRLRKPLLPFGPVVGPLIQLDAPVGRIAVERHLLTLLEGETARGGCDRALDEFLTRKPDFDRFGAVLFLHRLHKYETAVLAESGTAADSTLICVMRPE